MSIPTATEIEKYLLSTRWRTARCRYFQNHPFAVCARCGISNTEHKARFGVRLELEHATYRTIGHEHDDELFPLCARCLKNEVADLPTDEWTGEALHRIRKRKKILGRLQDIDDTKLWDELERLQKLETYIWWCREKHPQDHIPFRRLLRCSRETVAAYLTVRKSRDESGKVPVNAFASEVLDELEENGLAVRIDPNVSLLDEVT